MALHEQSVGATDEWYTPKYVFDALGCVFDVDVAAAPNQRDVPAGDFIRYDSLSYAWQGFIWMNPPFGGRNAIEPWLEKFIEHGNGIALTPDRTSAPWWQSAARRVHGILFVSPKIKFIGKDGVPGKSPAQGTTLMAMGYAGLQGLERAYYGGLGVFYEHQQDRRRAGGS